MPSPPRLAWCESGEWSKAGEVDLETGKVVKSIEPISGERIYLSVCHHKKREDGLFPAVAEAILVVAGILGLCSASLSNMYRLSITGEGHNLKHRLPIIYGKNGQTDVETSGQRRG